jgi:hypothetical protein
VTMKTTYCEATRQSWRAKRWIACRETNRRGGKVFSIDAQRLAGWLIG